MTEAGWTRGRPTKPGWYWWRDCDCPSDPIIVRVVHDGYGLIVYGLEEYSRRLYETRGEWLGPITPDSYQAGAVRIVKRAKALQLHGLRDTDTNEFLEGYEAACVDILAALSKGRA